MSGDKQKAPSDYQPHHMGDGRRFHVRTYNLGLWQVYGAGLEYICECLTQGAADMVADALEQDAEKEISYQEARLPRGLDRPPDFPEVVCLCGSTRFMDAFDAVGWELTLRGIIVLTVGVCKHAEDHGGEALGQDVAERLDELHKRKIDMADRVFVLNLDGYIGDSTRAEIDYAKKTGKRITYLEIEIGEEKSS